MRKYCWCFNKLNSRPEFVMSCILRKRFFLYLSISAASFYATVPSLSQSAHWFLFCLVCLLLAWLCFFGVLFSFPFRSDGRICAIFRSTLFMWLPLLDVPFNTWMCKIHVVQPTVCGCRTFILVESIYLSMMSTVRVDSVDFHSTHTHPATML